MPTELVAPLKWILYAVAAYLGVYVLAVVGGLVIGWLLVVFKR